MLRDVSISNYNYNYIHLLVIIDSYKILTIFYLKEKENFEATGVLIHPCQMMKLWWRNSRRWKRF